MRRRGVPVISIILYALAGLLTIYTGWAVKHSYDYISEVFSAGQLVFKGNEYDIVSFYMTSCAQYVVFAIIFFTLGWMMQKNLSYKHGKQVGATIEKSSDIADEKLDDDESEDDFDDWFQKQK